MKRIKGQNYLYTRQGTYYWRVANRHLAVRLREGADVIGERAIRDA